MTNDGFPEWTRRRFLQGTAAAGAGSLGVTSVFETPISNDAAARLVARLQEVGASHPRLHFDAASRELLRGKARTSHERYARLLFEWVEHNRDWKPPAQAASRPLGEVELEQSAAFVTNAALAAVLSGKPGHVELARTWALGMCASSSGAEDNYALGLYAAGLARAYDWLFDEWNGDERRTLRNSLARMAARVHAGSFPGTRQSSWWAGLHLHHDFWVPTGGSGEAALALLGEVEEAAEWAARAKLEIGVCLSWLGDDGAWPEGAADWCYALAPLLWFYGAWQTVTGENPHDVPWLRQTANYRLYDSLPDGSYVYLNDSFRSGRYNTSGSASCHLLRRLAALFRDGHAQWLAERDEAVDLRPGLKGVYQAPYEGSSFRAARTEYPHAASQCAAWNVLWCDPSVTPAPPTDLPPSRRFANQDIAILRTGWERNSAVVSLACGPLAGQHCAERIRKGEHRDAGNFGHTHPAYNSFTLFAAGQYFIVPPGYARRSSYFQNSVTVNGADFTTDPAADVRLLGLVEQPDFTCAAGDAARAFLQPLGVAYYRRFLALFSDCLVVYDDLRLAPDEHNNWNHFRWSVHGDPQTHRLSLAGASAKWQAQSGDAPALSLNILAPEEFAWERATLESLDERPMLEALRLVRPEWYAQRMQVLAVFSLARPAVHSVVIRAGKSIGVAWPDLPERPAVAFSGVHPDTLGPDWPSDIGPVNRSLIAVGTDEPSLVYRRWDQGHARR